MAARHKPEQQNLGDLLRTLEQPVRYDVDRGYARHQRLLAKGTRLPEWVDALPSRSARGFVRKWVPWLGAGSLIVGALTWLAPPSPMLPDPRSMRATTPRVPGTSTDVSPSSPPVGARGEASAPSARVRADVAPGVPPAKPPRAPEAKLDPASRGQESPSVAPAPPMPSIEALALPSDAPPPVQAPNGAPHDHDGHGATVARRASATRVEARASARSSSTRVEAEAPRDRAEVLQLAQAERLLARDPEAAIALVRKGNVQFKRGYLQHERRYIEVMGLFAAGRAEEGKARAQFFLRDYPASPYRQKVQEVLAQKKAEAQREREASFP